MKKNWQTFAGGTSAHHGYSYAMYLEHGAMFSIEPPQRKSGGYSLKSFGVTKPYWVDHGVFRSPQAAKKFAENILIEGKDALFQSNPSDKPEERGTFIEIRGTKTGKLYLILNASIGTMKELRMTAQRIADKYKEQVSIKRVTKVKKNPTLLPRAGRWCNCGRRWPCECGAGVVVNAPKGTKSPRKPTIYEALRQKLHREPTNAELKDDVKRILYEGAAEGRKKRNVRLKKNPIEPSAEIADAKTLFESFTGHEANTARRVKTPAARVALAIGPLLGVAYETTRDGKREKYFHEFRSDARPLLAASSDGRSLFMLGGAYRFTDRGIVDSPKKRSR